MNHSYDYYTFVHSKCLLFYLHHISLNLISLEVQLKGEKKSINIDNILISSSLHLIQNQETKTML